MKAIATAPVCHGPALEGVFLIIAREHELGSDASVVSGRMPEGKGLKAYLPSPRLTGYCFGTEEVFCSRLYLVRQLSGGQTAAGGQFLVSSVRPCKASPRALALDGLRAHMHQCCRYCLCIAADADLTIRRYACGTLLSEPAQYQARW